MPRIPAYQAEVQQGVPRGESPVNVGQEVSASFAGPIGDLGEGLQRYALEDIKAAKEKSIRSLLANNNKQMAQVYASDLENEILKTGSLDGNDWVPTFDQSYDKWMQKTLKDLPNDDTKLAIGNELAEVKNATRMKLYEQSRKQFQKFTEDQYEQALNFNVAAVNRNPMQIDQNWADYKKLIDESAYTPANKLKAKEVGLKAMAESAIDGLSNSGQYDLAKSMVNTKFAGVFDAKRQAELLDKIDLEKSNKAKAFLQEVEYRDKLSGLALKHEQQLNQDQFSKEIQMFLDEPTSPAKFSNAKEMQRRIDLSIEDRSLNPQAGARLKKALNGGINDDQAHILNDWYDQFASASTVQDLAIVKTRLEKAYDEGMVSDTNYLRISQWLKTDQDRLTSKNERDKNKVNNALFKEHLASLKRMANDPFASKLDRVQNEAKLSQATTEYFRLSKYGPKGVQGDPSAAMEAVTKKFFGAVYYNRVPGLPDNLQVSETEMRQGMDNQVTPKLDAMEKALKDQYRENKISATEFTQRFEQIKNKREAFRIRLQNKSRGK